MKYQIAALLLLLVGSVSAASADTIHYLNSACRVLDTRQITGAAKAPANTNYNIHVRGSFSGQGGESGCTLPTSATGVVLSLVAVDPSGNGNIKLWAYGTTAPLSSSLNVTAAVNRNDSMIVRLEPFAGTYDLTALSTVDVHLVVDLIGYTEEESTTYFKGVVTSTESSGSPGNVTVGMTLDTLFPGFKLLCREPWIDPTICDTFNTNDNICGVGHIANDSGTAKLFVHELTDCL